MHQFQQGLLTKILIHHILVLSTSLSVQHKKNPKDVVQMF